MNSLQWKRRLSLAAPALLILAAFAGCGDDEEGGGSPSDTVLEVSPGTWIVKTETMLIGTHPLCLVPADVESTETVLCEIDLGEMVSNQVLPEPTCQITRNGSQISLSCQDQTRVPDCYTDIELTGSGAFSDTLIDITIEIVRTATDIDPATPDPCGSLVFPCTTMVRTTATFVSDEGDCGAVLSIDDLTGRRISQALSPR
jgi:hypothetical protein